MSAIFYLSSESFRVYLRTVDVDIYLIVVLVLILNFLGDYCSILETRYILKYMELSTRLRRVLILGILDIAQIKRQGIRLGSQ